METTSITTVHLETLVLELEPITRHDHLLTVGELMATAKLVTPVLRRLSVDADDHMLRAEAKQALDELEKMLESPEKYTEGVMSVVLTIARTAIRRIAEARRGLRTLLD